MNRTPTFGSDCHFDGGLWGIDWRNLQDRDGLGLVIIVLVLPRINALGSIVAR